MSKINFPTGPNNGDKFTFSGKTWNFNGAAWDKVSADGDVDSIATGTGGYVAFYTPEGVAGSTIGPAAEVLFWDDTNNRLGIGTTGPSQALEVVGGITASGPSTLNGFGFKNFGVFDAPAGFNLKLGTDDIHVKFRNSGFTINDTGSDISTTVLGNTDDRLLTVNASTDRVGVGVGAPQDKFHVNGGITASGGVVASGATFNGIVKANHLVLQEDGTISVQDDTEAMTLNFGGGVLDISSTAVDIEQKLRHRGDPNTYIDFTVDNIEMFAGDNSFLDSNGTRTNVGGVSFANGLVQAQGITVGAGGITFADGTTQTTAFRAGLKYTVTGTSLSDIPQPGGVVMSSNISGTAIDILGINAEDANGNNIDSVLDLYAANGGLIQILKEDGSELVIVATEADELSEALVSSDGSGGTRLTVTETSGMEVDTTPSVGDIVYVYVIPNLVSAVQTIGGEQGHIQIETAFGLSMANIANVGYLRVNPHHHFDFQGAEFSQTSNFAEGVTIGGVLDVASSIRHIGDSDTLVGFSTNRITLQAGDTTYQTIGLNDCTDFNSTEVREPKLKDYSEHVNAIGTVTSNTAVNFENGNVQTVTIGGNCEFSFSNPPASGQAGTMTLIITNGGAHTTTFASAIKWPGDVAPTLTTSGVDVISFLTTDGGTNIYGFVGGLNFS